MQVLRSKGANLSPKEAAPWVASQSFCQTSSDTYDGKPLHRCWTSARVPDPSLLPCARAAWVPSSPSEEFFSFEELWSVSLAG